MPDWTLDDIARQAARGGVNRQQVEQLVARVRELEDAIRLHRKRINPSWHPDVGMFEDWELWRLVDQDGRHAQEWQT